MIMKTISMMPESQRRVTMVKLAEMIKNGSGITEISSKLNIPESEIREAIDWVKKIKNR